jgi:RHS repeat-associated protein
MQASTASDTLTYMHTPMGIQGVENQAGDWHYQITDGLGSVRGQVDALNDMTASQMYDPYGQAFDVTGTFVGDFGFAGEQMDDSGLSYNRARYYNPSLGAFTALDPFEGLEERPMSMNGYAYAENNPANWTDPSGEFADGFAISQGLGLSPMIKGLVDLIVAGLGSLLSTKVLIVLAAALLFVAVASIIHVAIQGTKLVCITCNGAQVIDLLNNNPGVIDPAPDIDTDEFTPYTQREIEQALAPMGNPNSQPTPISTVFPVPNSTPFVITPIPTESDNEYIYRRAGNDRRFRVQDCRLSREADFLTGLSFENTKPSTPHGRFNVNRLVKAGYLVRFDGGELIYTLFTNEPYIVDGRHRKFGPSHVSLYLQDERSWEDWYNTDLSYKGTSAASGYAHRLCSLAETD